MRTRQQLTRGFLPQHIVAAIDGDGIGGVALATTKLPQVERAGIGKFWNLRSQPLQQWRSV